MEGKVLRLCQSWQNLYPMYRHLSNTTFLLPVFFVNYKGYVISRWWLVCCCCCCCCSLFVFCFSWLCTKIADSSIDCFSLSHTEQIIALNLVVICWQLYATCAQGSRRWRIEKGNRPDKRKNSLVRGNSVIFFDVNAFKFQQNCKISGAPNHKKWEKDLECSFLLSHIVLWPFKVIPQK